MSRDLTQGPIGKTLLQLTNPMVLGLFAVISLNLVDTFFVARLGTEELAGISITFPIVMLLMNLAMGLSVGTGSVVSRAIGKGEGSSVKTLTTASLMTGCLLMALLSAAGIATINPLFQTMGAEASYLPFVKDYMLIWYLGAPFAAIPIVVNGALGASGEMKIPAVMMGIAALLNLILDPILIFGLAGFPALGVQGASLATVLSYAAALFISLWAIGVKKQMLTFKLSLQEIGKAAASMCKIGIPAAGTQMIIPLLHSVTMWILSHYGAAAIAAYGIASRLESFALIILIALTSSLAAFIGQNCGAGKRDRVYRALKLGYLSAIAWGGFLFILFYLFAGPIARVFDPDPNVVSFVAAYLTIVPVSYGGAGAIYVANAFFNAIGKPLSATAVTLFRHFGLYLPAALFCMGRAGVPVLFGVIAGANLLGGLFAWGLSFSIRTEKGITARS